MKYYLDIETYSTGAKPNPETDKIVTIQWQPLDDRTGAPLAPLTMLKEWDTSESYILEKFFEVFKPWYTPWSFIPVGNSLHFERAFLKKRAELHKLGEFELVDLDYDCPCIDIQSILVLMNKGAFKGSGLHNFTDKEQNGSMIKDWYEAKEYDKIEKYVVDEADAFVGFYRKLIGVVEDI